MDKIRGSAAILILCMFLCLSITIGDEGRQNVEDQTKNPSFWEWEKLRSAHSNFSKVFSSSNWQWQIFKRIVYQAYSRFFSPNIDFRRGGEVEAEAETDGGAGEKVKQALSKSLGKSKSTMEDTAKSAAKIAGETVHKTKEKVKKSLSERERQHKNEL